MGSVTPPNTLLTITNELRSIPGTYMAAATPPSAMWSKDAALARSYELVDGRQCVNIYSDASPVTPFDPRNPCGDAAICNWSYWKANVTCDAQAFVNVMFQADRYQFAQTQLQALLMNKPADSSIGMTAAQGAAWRHQWADWCINVMRLVSLARWASNLRPAMQLPLDQGLYAQQALTRIKGDLRVPYRVTSARNAEAADANNLCTLMMFAPRLLDAPFTSSLGGLAASQINVAANLPSDPGAFDPASPPVTNPAQFRQGLFDFVGDAPGAGVVSDGHSGWDSGSPWPIEDRDLVAKGTWDIKQSPDDHVRMRALMYAWFEKTLKTGYWRKIDIHIPDGTFAGRWDHWWGTADALIELCTAWAQDTIAMPFGHFVADGLVRWLAAYEAIPPQFRILSQENINSIRGSVNSAFSTAQGAAGAVFGVAAGAVNVVPVIGQVASAVIALIGALVQALFEFLKQLHAAAYGGAELAAACIPPPVIRMIISDDTQACNFDPRNGQAEAVAARTQAVATVASTNAPVSTWFDASRYASGETDQAPQLALTSRPPSSGLPLWLWGLLAVGVAGGAYWALK